MSWLFPLGGQSFGALDPGLFFNEAFTGSLIGEFTTYSVFKGYAFSKIEKAHGHSTKNAT